MLKFDVLNRFSGGVQFTAEIDCEENAPRGMKLRLAVLWAIKARANLREADLSEANLRGANLRGANLRGADLRGADLSEANLREADLRWANLRGANLSEANLRWADLSEANLRRADLREADLSEANLREADLRWANLRGANLSEVRGYIVGPQRSDGYRFDLRLAGEAWVVVAGCRTIKNWTTAQYRAHAATYYSEVKRAETLAILGYLDAMAKLVEAA